MEAMHPARQFEVEPVVVALLGLATLKAICLLLAHLRDQHLAPLHGEGQLAARQFETAVLQVQLAGQAMHPEMLLSFLVLEARLQAPSTGAAVLKDVRHVLVVALAA